MTFIIASHNNGESARALAERLNCRLVSHSSSKALPKSVRTVINFGCSTDHPTVNRLLLSRYVENMLNPNAAVDIASSKLRSFLAFEEFRRRMYPTFRFPRFYTDQAAANYACLVDGFSIVARTVDRGSSGAGIVVLTPEQARAGQGLPAAQLYVKAIDKGREYRVHVGIRPDNQGMIIDVTRKIRRPDATGERGFVWNHDNDFIFVREGVNRSTIPQELLRNAIRAVRALGLNFGAVDIVVPRRGRESIRNMPCYVLEVNTAPGMEGTTLERYAEFFESFYGLNATNRMETWQGDASVITSNEDDAPDETYALGA